MKLQNAYATVSDPEKRRAYDTRWAGIREKLRTQKEADRRQAEAAETEKKKAAEESAKRQKEDTARQERLRYLKASKVRYDNDIFETKRVVRKLTADLKRLQDQDDEDLRKEREQNSWRAHWLRPSMARSMSRSRHGKPNVSIDLPVGASKEVSCVRRVNSKGSKMRSKM